MTLASKVNTLSRCVRNVVLDPVASVRRLAGVPDRGATLAQRWPAAANPARSSAGTPNPLRAYFDGVTEGPGIWKWQHYFDPYHHHLAKFVGRDVSVVEVGVYSGGSLAMWTHYFGTGCRVHGVDIQEECRVYEDARTTIHIGDQADRAFWRQFRQSVPEVDVMIDDGGHLVEQQIVTLEEMLPHLRPGGVYVCEDIHGVGNGFAAFASSLADQLNAFATVPDHPDRASAPTPFQSAVSAMHLYPYLLVIEKTDAPVEVFTNPRHGTQWQPFL